VNNPIRLAAKGTVTAVGPVTKAKKAGGTYTVNEATLDRRGGQFRLFPPQSLWTE
jgi:hypothetical protein